MKSLFLAVTGPQGSGKSVFTEVAKTKYKILTYRMGDVIIEECKKREMTVNSRNMGKMASVLRYEGGDQVVARKSLPAIKELARDNPKMIIIDGIRSFSELALFKEELGNVRLVVILTSLRVRKQRVEARKRIDLESMGDFEEREQRELGFGLGNVITKADYFLLNEDISKEEFIENIKEFLETILAEI